MLMQAYGTWESVTSWTYLAMHWIPILFLSLMMIIVWFPNMVRKERSLSRYPGFADYKRRSSLFIPFIY